MRYSPSKGFATYLNAVVVDQASLVAVILLTLAVLLTPMYHFAERTLPAWPTMLNNTMIVSALEARPPSEYWYPLEREPLPSWACALVVVLVPWLVIGLFQIKLRSLWDFHAGAVGIAKAVVSTTFVTTILKHFVGGYRPHFMEACKPNAALVQANLNQQIYWFNTTVCTASRHDVVKALQGFPSGHSSNSFAAAIFLALYLNAKLKAFSDHASDFWTFVVTIAPLIGASLVSGCMYTSHQHHAHEIIFGIILGLILGVLAYRSVYASVLDFHYNHIPLPPFSLRTRFSYSLSDSYVVSATLQEGGVTEYDRLVVWNWWKQTGVPEDQEKEVAWLRSLRSLKATGRDLRPIFRNKDWKGKLRREASEAVEIPIEGQGSRIET